MKIIKKFSICILFYIIIMMIYLLYINTTEYNNVDIDTNNYEIYLNNEKININDINNFKFNNFLKKGTKIQLIKEISKENFENNNTITFFTENMNAQVFVDNEKIYEIYNNTREYPLVENRYNIITLYEHNIGQILRIEFTVLVDNTIKEIPTIISSNNNNNIKYIFNEKILDFLLSYSLLLLGIIGCALSLYFIKNKKEFLTIFSFTLSMILIGLFGICDCALLTAFRNVKHVAKIIEYICFCNFPITFIMFFINYNKNTENLNKILNNIKNMLMLLNIMIAILTYLDKFPTQAYINTVHLICLIIALIESVALYKTKTDDKSLSYVKQGMLFFMSANIISALSFLKNEKINLVIYGLFVFSLLVLIGYIKKIIVIEKEIQLKKELSKLAYTDMLTGTFNRAKYEELLDNYNDNDIFGMIFFDLNGLKKTNDNCGHESGDKLIKCFANLLNKSINTELNICRIGGDEFTVLFKNKSKNDINMFLNNLNKNIEEHNQNENNVFISTSYGYVYSEDELSHLSIKDMVKIADDRMYKMKKGHSPKKI